MALKDIVGQEKSVNILYGIMERQKIASSYLFCGEPGIGKKLTAINFVKALNCLKANAPAPDNSSSSLLPDFVGSTGEGQNSRLDACDECASCLKIDAGTHPDFLLISPDEKQIRIEEIRGLDEKLSFKPFEGRRKAVIVDDADMMNLPAANAFLKTLEEPPLDSVIILVSSRPDRLPATIMSRCSRINFKPLSSELCRNVLSGKVPGNKLELVSSLSMGRPGIALSDDLIEEKQWFLQLYKDMLKAEKDRWASREEMEQWFEHLFVFLRDIVVLKLTGEGSGLVNCDLYDYLKQACKSIDIKVIINVHDKLVFLNRNLMFNLNKSITWNYTASLLRKELAGTDA